MAPGPPERVNCVTSKDEALAVSSRYRVSVWLFKSSSNMSTSGEVMSSKYCDTCSAIVTLMGVIGFPNTSLNKSEVRLRKVLFTSIASSRSLLISFKSFNPSSTSKDVPEGLLSMLPSVSMKWLNRYSPCCVSCRLRAVTLKPSTDTVSEKFKTTYPESMSREKVFNVGGVVSEM